MGLNLTAAGTPCSIFSFHPMCWECTTHYQLKPKTGATVGQKKPVTIIEMVTRGTVDEAIYSLQERKERMNEAIMDEKGNTKKAGDNDDIKVIKSSSVWLPQISRRKAQRGESIDFKSEQVEMISIDD